MIRLNRTLSTLGCRGSVLTQLFTWQDLQIRGQAPPWDWFIRPRLFICNVPDLQSHMSQTLSPYQTWQPFQLSGMDYVGLLPHSQAGNTYILHVIDYFS